MSLATSVYPSAGALVASCTPMVLLAPGLFSITKGCPSWSASFCETLRVATSTAPPGAQGTITLTGFVGHCCARTCVDEAIAKHAITRLSLFMWIPLSVTFPFWVAGPALVLFVVRIDEVRALL